MDQRALFKINKKKTTKYTVGYSSTGSVQCVVFQVSAMIAMQPSI